MNIIENDLYKSQINKYANLPLDWDKLSNSSVLISGATGLIGSFLTDIIMKKNEEGLNCKIYALALYEKEFDSRFNLYLNNDNFVPYACDVTKSLPQLGKIDYIFHLASNTSPLLYVTNPIKTITTNFIGMMNLLEYAARCNTKRVLFGSSVEIYGQNRGDVDYFDEDYCGYLNSNTLRASYPESKRITETLCHAYIQEKDLDIVITRIARAFGPTMFISDTKAISQFLMNGVRSEDIILKSKGDQLYSFMYVGEVVSGILWTFFYGQKGEAYNISYKDYDIRLIDFANIIADYCSTKVIFDLPTQKEAEGYSKVTKALLNSDKLQKLGWSPLFNIKESIESTIDVLKFLYN